MSDDADRAVPRQRTRDLVVRARDDGTLILDRRTDTAHYLPADVTQVWRACTGKTTLAEVASAAGVYEPIAASAVDQLIELDLLEVRTGIDRRKFLRRSALVGAGAVAASTIETVVAPLPQAAASPVLVDVVTLCPPASPAGTRQIQFVLTNGVPNVTYTVTFSISNGQSGTLSVPTDFVGSGTSDPVDVTGDITTDLTVTGTATAPGGGSTTFGPDPITPCVAGAAAARTASRASSTPSSPAPSTSRSTASTPAPSTSSATSPTSAAPSSSSSSSG